MDEAVGRVLFSWWRWLSAGFAGQWNQLWLCWW